MDFERTNPEVIGDEVVRAFAIEVDERQRKQIEAVRDWKAQNKERVRLVRKAWREKNKERLKEYKKSYRQAGQLKRDDVLRVRSKGARFLIDLMASQGGRCALCGDGLKERHLDHIVPRSRGGKDEAGNYRFLCPRCNYCKGGLMDDEFILHIRKILSYRA